MPLVVCLVIALSGSAHAFDTPARDPRVRAMGSRLAEIIETGGRQSATFRSLLDRLEEGDVIVYLQIATLPSSIQGRLRFMSAVAGRRYVLIEVARELDAPRMIAMVGHELQHAVEILDAPEIVDRSTMAAAYGRWGYRKRYAADGWVGFDTAAAVLVGRQVGRELAGGRVTLATR